GAVPVFVSVTVSGALVTLSRRDALPIYEGVSVAADAVPVPERLAVCGLPLASSVTVKVAVRAAVAVGVNVTLMVQLELAASVEGVSGQLFVWPKSPGFRSEERRVGKESSARAVLDVVTDSGR